MRRYLFAAAVVLLLAVGCTSGDEKVGAGSSTTAGDGGSSTTLDPEEVAKAPGVTDAAVKVGVNYVDEASLAKSGINFKLGDYKGSYEALVDQINDAGGIHGRKIELVFAPINPVGTTPAEAACLKLTEDEQVFVAVGFFLGDAALCPLETHETAVIGGGQSAEQVARAKAPWFTLTPGPETPKQVIRTMHENGDLDGKVAVFAAAADGPFMEDEILPLLDELGVEPVEQGVLADPLGDTNAAKAGTKVIAQRFKAAGADTVLLVGNNSFNWLNSMQDDPYQPRLLITDPTAATAFLSNATTSDTSLLEGAVAGGIYGPDDRIYEEPKMQACISDLEDAGVEVPPPDPADANEKRYTGPFDACKNVTFLHAILEAAGKDLNYATFRQAGYELGEVDIPGDPSPLTFGPPPATDGAPKAYLSSFDAATETFVPDE